MSAPQHRHPGIRQGTYSIVARDPESGELGVAVQSHWFSVGSIVTWARPEVGAVATQANAEVSYGPKGLDLMAQGRSAQQALDQLLTEDPGSAGRQVAMVDAQGTVAAHTGTSAMAHAGHVTGEAVSCQANIMASDTVWPAMLAAYERTTGRLTGRLLAALDAAEAEGGDLRGRQSAALLVVPGSGEPWREVVSLRVEDHPDPLTELRRLVAIHDAYALADRADGLVNEGRHEEAAALYGKASELAPGNYELQFWAGLGAAQGGDLEGALRTVQRAIAAHPPMGELLERLPPDIAPSAEAVRTALRATG